MQANLNYCRHIASFTVKTQPVHATSIQHFRSYAWKFVDTTESDGHQCCKSRTCKGKVPRSESLKCRQRSWLSAAAQRQDLVPIRKLCPTSSSFKELSFALFWRNFCPASLLAHWQQLRLTDGAGLGNLIDCLFTLRFSRSALLCLGCTSPLILSASKTTRCRWTDLCPGSLFNTGTIRHHRCSSVSSLNNRENCVMLSEWIYVAFLFDCPLYSCRSCMSEDNKPRPSPALLSTTKPSLL